MFHLGDTYFFFNELIKAQATTRAENDIFIDYATHKRKNERFYGRSIVGVVVAPYMVSLFARRSIAYKLLTGWLIYTCLDALYDMGVYTYFFIHGPKFIRRLI